MGQIQKKSEWLLNYNFKNSEDNKVMPVVLRKKKFALNPNLETKYEVEKIIFRHERFLKTIKWQNYRKLVKWKAVPRKTSM